MGKLFVRIHVLFNRGMDVGTAKPTRAQQARVKHHLIDAFDPDERFTAAMFQEKAHEVIRDIRAQGKTPFLVGGIGLYIDSIILNYRFGGEVSESERKTYRKMSITDLHALLKKRHITIPRNEQNKCHLVRALEQGIINTDRSNDPKKVHMLWQ